ncbi:ABC transporter permease [Streptomyces albidoflavus]|uniref:ABC transporter permease n=1 Tax=Streptomyces albidoflavus TaxID=1886 RepID=UPI0033E86F0D
MFRTALRTVLAHKARLLMTVLAVLLGVAFVSGTLVFTDTLGNAFNKQSAKSYKDVDVSVTTYFSDDKEVDGRKPEPGLSPEVLDEIGAIDGVASVTPRVNGFSGVADPDGKLIGNGWSNTGTNFAPGENGKDPAYDFGEGTGPTEAGQVALDKDSASRGEYKVGQPVRVATNEPVKEYTLSGIFTTEDGAVNAGGSLVLFEPSVAQKLFLKPGYFQMANVKTTPGASDTKIRGEIESLVPEDATVQTGKQLADQEAADIKRELSDIHQMLLAFAAIALFVGTFLISNTFTMLVAQRTKELALLRAVGASRSQVKRSVMAEALIVGLVASTIGFVLGVGLAVGLRSAMGQFGAVPAGPLMITPTAAAAAFGVGVVTTLIAAWLPARRAAKIPPVAAMSSVHAVATMKSLVLRNSVGAVLTLIGAAGIIAGAGVGKDGRPIIGAGAFFSLVGVIVLIPLLSRPIIALVQPLLNRLYGVAGKLAGQNAVRNPRRTGASASALAIGLTLVTGLTILGVTLGTAVDKSTTDNIKADYTITMAVRAASLDESVVKALQKAPGVSAVSPQRASNLVIDGKDSSASGVTPGDIQQLLTLKAETGSLDSLSGDAIAVASDTAKSRGWKTGDTVTVKYEDDKTARLKIGATYEPNEFASPTLISTDLVGPHEERPYTPEVYVSMDGGATEANEPALVDALGDNPAISIADQQDIRNQYGGMLNTALHIMYGLLGIALIIAVLGVVNTLAMSVFERQQEIGMLRAIGLDSRRVKRMIRLEAVVISVFGALVGVGLGTFLAWAIGETVRGSIPGYVLVLPWERIGIFLVLAGLVGVLAALWPARRAAKLNMLTAIKTE